ncbi:MAG TPA: glycosyltransferase [Lacunisphaera sp.]|jgi:glycosyltransferase involved in cell wall biosynthesis
MRVLHVLFSPRIAGSERYCIDLANRQADLGHEVHIIGSRGSPLATALAPNVCFHGLNWIFRRLRVRRLINRIAPDICHGHLSPACKALKGLPSTQQTVGSLHVGYKPHQHASLDGLICVNRAQARRLGDYRGLVRTIPNWMPLAPVAPTTTGIREELGLGDAIFLIGAVGRLHPSKGMDVLISAFRASAPATAALVILGEGPQRAELERLCAGDPRIHLPGYRANVYGCLHDLDLFVSPSREESFGLAIVEAMSTGVPIIATSAEGPAEFLRDQPAVLVAPGAVEAMAEALAAAHRRFCTDELPRVGYDLSLFDPAARLANIMDFYSQVIESRQRRTAKQRRQVAATT